MTAYRPAIRIRAWYQEHMGPRHPNAPHRRSKATRTATTPPRVTDTRKDPAEPHPDDVQLLGKPSSPPPSPAEQRSLTTVTRLGGYTYPATTPTPEPPLQPPRPSLQSILKTHREANGPSRTDPTAPRLTTVKVNKSPAQIRPTQ